MRPRLLDMYCGAGIGGSGYKKAGFQITGIDNKPQDNNPFEHYLSDAIAYAEKHWREFDAFHASPPCPRFSSLTRLRGKPSSHPDLIAVTREFLQSTGKPYVIENVEGAPLRVDLKLCGTMFGIRFPKHRIFELSFQVNTLLPPCNHNNVYDPFHGGEDSRDERVKLCNLYGVDWFVTRQEVRNAIPPAYTEYIGKYLLQEVTL